MAGTELVVRLVAGVVLTLANAFFVATEFALTRLPQFDESEFKGSAGLERAWEMTQELEIYLTGCQLGITTSSILLGIVAEPAVTALLAPPLTLIGLGANTVSVVSVVAAVVLINLIHKIWGEQAPTYLGVEKPKIIARYAAPVHYGWTMLTYPFILLGDGIAKKTLGLFGVTISRSWTDAEDEDEDTASVGSRTELKRRMASLMRGQDIPAERREEILSTLDIGTRPVREIMVPRSDIAALKAEQSLDDNLEIIAQNPHSRFPLVRESSGEVIGTIYAPALLRNIDALRDAEATLEEVAAPSMTVPATTSVSRLIDVMQRREQELALVENDTDLEGLVTITDAFEAIAGDVRDPLDDAASNGTPSSAVPNAGASSSTP
jgi:CBS domain containing-hemolysin-like protein